MTPVDEVLLRRQALPQRRDPPLRDEGVRCHGVYASTTSLSALGELGLVLTTGSRELDGSLGERIRSGRRRVRWVQQHAGTLPPSRVELTRLSGARH